METFQQTVVSLDITLARENVSGHLLEMATRIFSNGWEEPVCKITRGDFGYLIHHPQVHHRIPFPTEKYLKVFGITFEIDWANREETNIWDVVVHKDSAEVHNLFRFQVYYT